MTKLDEIGISLNGECKKLIDEFVGNNFVQSVSQQTFWKYQITELVEKCIYLDNHAKDNLEHGTNE